MGKYIGWCSAYFSISVRTAGAQISLVEEPLNKARTCSLLCICDEQEHEADVFMSISDACCAACAQLRQQASIACLGVAGFNQGDQFFPRHNLVPLSKKNLVAGNFAACFTAFSAQSSLAHRSESSALKQPQWLGISKFLQRLLNSKYSPSGMRIAHFQGKMRKSTGKTHSASNAWQHQKSV